MPPASALSAHLPCEWVGFVATDFSFSDFPPGARVLDIGFGTGEQMGKLRAHGCRTFGIEYDAALAQRGGARGLPVCRSAAEALPFATAALDGVICKVVVPYTDEARAIAEIGRVLRTGGTARLSYHGLGYSLRYLLADRSWRRRVYGLRTIVNTVVYRLTGRRLPGFIGDTVYQSARRLRRYYAAAGLKLVQEHAAAAFAGAPVFIYHVVQKVDAGSAVTEDWSPYLAAEYSFTDFPPGSRVLDVGFGSGTQMRGAAAAGCRTFGIEYDARLARQGRANGLAVCQASSERLPIRDASLDGVICKVVILLTDEARSIAEIARVLRPGAMARVSYHGVGYSLKYLLAGPGWKRRVYGLRTIANTLMYRLTGRRLPGFLGDTLFQTSARLRHYYGATGLDLVEERPSPRYAGAPVFIYHTLRRRA